MGNQTALQASSCVLSDDCIFSRRSVYPCRNVRYGQQEESPLQKAAVQSSFCRTDGDGTFVKRQQICDFLLSFKELGTSGRNIIKNSIIFIICIHAFHYKIMQ